MLGSVSIALLLCELVLRAFFPQVDQVGRLFSFDPDLGWTFTPNECGLVIYPGEARVKVCANSWGFRDDEFHAESSETKIMVIGDSFTSNIAVDHDSVFTELMERELEGGSVWNFGVNGFNNIQELLLLRRYYDIVEPDVVVVVIYIRNDFSENFLDGWAYQRPTAAIEEGEIRISPLPENARREQEDGFFVSELGRFHLIELLRRGYLQCQDYFSDKRQPSSLSPPEFYLCNTRESKDFASMVEVTKGIMGQMADFCSAQDVPFLFVLAPSILQVNQELWDYAFDYHGISQEGFSNSVPNDRLVEISEKEGWPVVDLLPVLRGLYESNGDQRLYNEIEQHWTPYGNECVADALLPEIRKMLVR